MQVEQIIKKLAEDEELPEAVVKEAVYSMFKFAKHIMDNDKLEGIQFIGFGKFIIKPAKKKFITAWRHVKSRLNKIEEEINETVKESI